MINKLILFLYMIKINIYNILSSDINKWPSVENDHSKLQFILPEILRRKDGYLHKDALFGYPGYNIGSLEVQVVSTNSTACIEHELNNESWTPPYALMINRGECHFVEKVRNAQHAGARAVIIVDNKCLCTDSDCLRATGDTVCESVLPYMADDESGGDITIPSMLIRKSDGDQIRKQLDQNEYVMVRFDWGIPSPDGRVEWTMWHSSCDIQSSIILKELQLVVEKLGDKAFFTPRFVSYNGTAVGCRKAGGSNPTPCGNMCINKGRYCLLDPTPFHDQSTGASGADVVIENLRRKCIWNHVSDNEPGVGTIWWKYANEFSNECQKSEEKFKDKSCAVKIMERLGINSDQIEECMKPYGEDVDEENKLLEEEISEQTQLQLLRLPAIYIDGIHARGNINGPGILSMICAGYGNHDPPSVCECSTQSPGLMMECVKKGGYINMSKEYAKEHGMGFGTVFLILFIISGTVVSAGYIYWRRTQRHMREQVRSILAEYMPLEEQPFDEEMEGPGMHPAARASLRSPRGYLPTKNQLDDDDDDM